MGQFPQGLQFGAYQGRQGVPISCRRARRRCTGTGTLFRVVVLLDLLGPRLMKRFAGTYLPRIIIIIMLRLKLVGYLHVPYP